MSLPGFTGDSSLYRSANHYSNFASVSGRNGEGIVASAILPPPTPCGGAGQPCCPVVFGSGASGCGPGLICNDNGICRKPCGDLQQRCCSGGRCNSPYVCDVNGTCRKSCGGGGQHCCANQTCDPGFACVNGTCQPCGGPNQPCCPGGGCKPGGICSPQGVCVGCGYPSEPCCPGGYCFQGVCDAAGFCEDCGNLGEPCCPGGLCNFGFSCNLFGTCS
jgi:hypothetical protein